MSSTPTPGDEVRARMTDAAAADIFAGGWRLRAGLVLPGALPWPDSCGERVGGAPV